MVVPVFIQRTQNKDALAIHLKLNEIVAAVEGANDDERLVMLVKHFNLAFGRQRDQVQFLHALFAFLKSLFSAPAIAFDCCKPVILGSKSGLQPAGLLLSQKHPKRRHDCRDRNQCAGDNDDDCFIHY